MEHQRCGGVFDKDFGIIHCSGCVLGREELNKELEIARSEVERLSRALAARRLMHTADREELDRQSQREQEVRNLLAEGMTAAAEVSTQRGRQNWARLNRFWTSAHTFLAGEKNEK